MTDGTTHCSRLLSDLATQAGVRVIENASCLDVRLSNEGTVEGLVYQSGGAFETLKIQAVFVAPDISPPEQFTLLKRAAAEGRVKLFPSGVCNGIRYNDHEALAADGVRAAREILASQT